MPTSERVESKTEKRVLFRDDFSGRELDRTKWNVRVTGNIYNDEQQAYVDSSETIYIASEAEAPGAAGGALALHSRFLPGYRSPEGVNFDFVSGRIDSRDKFDFKYGRAAARMMLPAGAGFWPAFWLMGYGAWPATGEIDVLEYVGEADWVSAAVHGPGYSGEAGLVNKLYFGDDNDARDWHVYAVDWGPDSMVFKVDELTVLRVTRAMTAFFGNWVFDNKKYAILNLALGGTYPFKTNGVQAPYYGLPEESVQLIKGGEAKVLVDWVEISQEGVERS